MTWQRDGVRSPVNQYSLRDDARPVPLARCRRFVASAEVPVEGQFGRTGPPHASADPCRIDAALEDVLALRIRPAASRLPQLHFEACSVLIRIAARRAC